jgi:hypothetical protein
MFERRVETMQELVDELYAGRFTALQLPRSVDEREDRLLGTS